LRRSRPCADARHRQTVNEWPVPTGHRVQRPMQPACNGRVTACNTQRGTYDPVLARHRRFFLP
jgi:hypothetical protein